MSGARGRRFGLIVTLALVAANLVAFNALLAGWSTARLDLTRERRFSISRTTRDLLASLEDDLRIEGYFSKRTHPKLAPLVPEIEDLLDEYRALGKGRVSAAIVDPGEDERAEAEARDRFGVASTPFRLASKYETGIVNAYFALVVRYGDQYVRYGFDDLIEVEPLPDGDVGVRLRNPEYDLTRAIKKVVYGFRRSAELFERAAAPVHLTAVMTPEALPEVFREVPEAVRKAAEELKKSGGERFAYREIEPADEATRLEVGRRYGVRPMSLGLLGDAPFYLYGFLEVGERIEPLALTHEGVSAASVREAVENALRRLTPGFLKTVGVVTPEPSLPPEVLMQFRMQGQMPPQPPPEFDQVREMLRQDYEVRTVALEDAGGVPTDVDLLLVLKPRDLGPRAVYHLDQYLMRGGRAIVCAGSYEVDFATGGLGVRPVGSGLDEWLAHHGIRIEKTLLLDDRNQALPIPQIRNTPFGALRTWVLRPYPYLVEVRDDGLAERTVAARLEAVGIYWGSPVSVLRDSLRELRPIEILASSARSWTDDDLGRVEFVDYEVPAQGTRRHLVSVALQGRFESFYATRPPPGRDPGAADGEGRGDVPLTRSPETRLAVVGNAEFLSDFVARALRRDQGGFFAQNLGFMQNLIDWMTLDNDLIGIRSRSAAPRPLRRLPAGAEAAVEAANYLLPLVALAAFGALRLWRRRRASPAAESARLPAGTPEASA